jgi:hypothetical protein
MDKIVETSENSKLKFSVILLMNPTTFVQDVGQFQNKTCSRINFSFVSF